MGRETGARSPSEEHYARAQEAPAEWVLSGVVLPDRSELPAGRANAYSRLAVISQVSSRRTARDLIALGTEIPQHRHRRLKAPRREHCGRGSTRASPTSRLRALFIPEGFDGA